MVYNTTERIYDLSLLEEKMAQRKWTMWFSDVTNRAPTFSEAFFVYFFDTINEHYVREYVIDHYPIDFALLDIRLLIDVDSPSSRSGGGKSSKKKKGDKKEQYLRNLGWDFYRFNWVKCAFTFNREITENSLDNLIQYIQEKKNVP